LHYYKKYMGDYDRLAARKLPTAYHCGDTWGNYDAVAKMIEKRFAEWSAET